MGQLHSTRRKKNRRRIPSDSLPEFISEKERLSENNGKVVYIGEMSPRLPINKTDDDIPIVVKSVNIASIDNERANTGYFNKELCRIFHKHPNLVDLICIIETPRHMLFIEEYCAGGDMVDYIWEMNSGRPLTMPQCVIVMRQLLSAIAYLHKHHILHRDIKLENVLLTNLAPPCVLAGHTIVKLCDFDFACKWSYAQQLPPAGTLSYCAPEILLYHGQPNTYATDVWAFGVCCYAMATTLFPFYIDGVDGQPFAAYYKENFIAIYANVGLDDKMISLLRDIFNLRPLLRPTAAELLKTVNATLLSDDNDDDRDW